REAQTSGKPELLDLQIVAYEVDFARDRNQVGGAIAQRPAQQVPESDDDLPRACRPRIDQPADRVQRIEQEVRVQLHAQRVQARTHVLVLELREAQAMVAQVKIGAHTEDQHQP